LSMRARGHRRATAFAAHVSNVSSCCT